MEFEPWMLLAFPLFFGMGWLAARVDVKELLAESNALPQSYFQGLNFLLSEQQDKAIEAFIEVVEVDSKTVELHFALGSLFRRRGEIDRALRMHHNLADRADLDNDKRQQAVFELAQDYLKAGIFDRAESLFRELKNSDYAKSALVFLLELYQKEHDWFKAIEIARQLNVMSVQKYSKQVAAFYCELAVEDIACGDTSMAQKYLREALSIYPSAVRATMMLGDLAANKGELEEAIDIWREIEAQNAQYLPLVSERILNAYRSLMRETEGVSLLRGYLLKCDSQDLLDVIFGSVLKNEGANAAYQLVRDELKRNPTLLGLDKLLEATLLDASIERRDDIEIVKNLVHKRTRSLAMYHCSHCGFKARQFYWHCPACQAWDSYSPRRNEEHESSI